MTKNHLNPRKGGHFYFNKEGDFSISTRQAAYCARVLAPQARWGNLFRPECVTQSRWSGACQCGVERAVAFRGIFAA
jgi:hypothetical protein